SYGCAKTSFVPVDFIEGGGNNSIPPYIGTTAFGGHPNPKHPEPGDFIAMDIRTGKVLWRHTLKSTPSSAALTTAGGLAILVMPIATYISTTSTAASFFTRRVCQAPQRDFRLRIRSVESSTWRFPRAGYSFRHFLQGLLSRPLSRARAEHDIPRRATRFMCLLFPNRRRC